MGNHLVLDPTRFLGEPYARIGQSHLYHSDCLREMPKLPASSFALTLTSPPYNIGKEYESRLPMEAYLAWCEQWISEVYRLTRDEGAFWLNLGYVPLAGRAKALPLAYLLWERVPFFLIQEVVWNYGAGVAGKRFFSPRNEKLLWWVKDADRYTFNLDAVRDPDVKYPNQKKNGKIRVNPLGKNPSDVWQIAKVTSGAGRASRERTSHPAQFPEALVERVMLASSDPGDWVLEPFAGSGTTGVVANRLGRPSVLFEKEERYCEITAERLRRSARG